jgi:peptidoglycan hydrolase CwlO-like protein
MLQVIGLVIVAAVLYNKLNSVEGTLMARADEFETQMNEMLQNLQNVIDNTQTSVDGLRQLIKDLQAGGDIPDDIANRLLTKVDEITTDVASTDVDPSDDVEEQPEG